MKESVTVRFEYITKETGTPVNVEATVKFEQEHFGADADGNRGIWQWEYQDLEEIIVTNKVLGDVTDKMEKEYENDFFDLVEMAIEKAYDEIA